MFFRLLLESFRRQRRRKLLAGAAILLGTTAVTAMLALATTIGDRIHQELAVYGANIVVTPQADLLDVKVGGVNLKPATGGAYLHESDLARLHGIFWANNITGVSPELPVTLHAALSATQDHTAGTQNHTAGTQDHAAGTQDHTAGTQDHTASNPSPPAGRNSPPDGRHSERSEESPHLSRTTNPINDSATTEIPAIGLWFNHRFASPSGIAEGKGFTTGAPELHPWWKITGSWPSSTDQIVLGTSLASQLHLHQGDTLQIELHDSPEEASANANRAVPRPMEKQMTVTGILSTGDATEAKALLPLTTAQFFNASPDAVSRVDISARTKPEDAFAKSDPAKLSPKQHDRWYCSPYANSIAYQIREAIPGAQAEQVRRVEQSEGTVLARISGLMWLISAAALLAAGFAVSAAMATAILERRAEIGLMRSLGASRGVIALLFYSETGVLAILAGGCGYLIGSGLAAWLGARIFAADGAAPTMHLSAVLIPALLPVVVGLALLVAIAGSTPAINTALSMSPSAILRADA